MVTRDRPPIHPGVTLKEDVMDELDLNASDVGRILGIPANRISEIVRGRRAVTADTALRLSEWLGTSPEFWLRLQEKYDLERTRMERGDEIRRQVTERRAVPLVTGE
ncbi:MAG TPA: HigA family addiction module antitoxin [Thermomicrobiales bacterium]|nr:HigA family addiction module antitoxin [Thermomicrobiales bacterium]